MKTKEFEEYLLAIGGLKNGFYLDRPNIVTNLCECSEEWLQLIHDLIEELIKAGWNKEICQIKEKFGGLRFYINEGNDEIFKIIDRYEELSFKTCEDCGSVEEVETLWKEGWIRTLCNKCYIPKPIHKFNNGLGATLCNKCYVIISIGMTEELYCNNCKK